MEYTVDVEKEGLRLDQFLSAVLQDVSRARIQKIIVDGLVSVNGNHKVKKNILLKIHDIVSIDEIPERFSESTPQAQDIALDVIYEDEFLVCINKPAGLVVHPGNGNADGTVVNALLHRFGSVSDGFNSVRPGIVHRPDKDTSGVLIIAKTNGAHSALAELFSSRKIVKKYTGICVGNRPLNHELLELPLARSRREPLKRAVDINGKTAVTEYSLREFKSGISLMEFTLHTGRTHQIRVHCSHKGFPIVQDGLYGGLQDRVLKIAPLERPFAYSIMKCFTRHALHARSVEFLHPFTNQKLSVTAPYPQDFCEAFEKLSESDNVS
ncbi:MAG: RluA family pseudouridine synthase [Chitinispirillales bacterium]|jgi:23S rRNA pseudouridine1911/1915/1917 synthase|nr:RluA family pseudouridine synthase [Chitinispirillales bacterium]